MSDEFVPEKLQRENRGTNRYLLIGVAVLSIGMLSLAITVRSVQNDLENARHARAKLEQQIKDLGSQPLTLTPPTTVILHHSPATTNSVPRSSPKPSPPITSPTSPPSSPAPTSPPTTTSPTTSPPPPPPVQCPVVENPLTGNCVP